MKKILVCLLAFCMLLSLFSCSAAKEPSEDVKETAKETKTEEKKPEETREKENTETVYEDLTSDYKKLIEFRFSESFGEKWQDKLHSVEFSDTFRGMIASFMTDDRTDVISQMIEGLDDTFSPKGVEDFGTVLFDLNQDGVQELFWVRRDHSILAVFTVHGGEAVLLDTFWPRHKGYVSGNGELYGYGSGGEQDLRHRVVVFGKQLVVGVHQFTLTHGSGSLLGGDVLGPFLQAQLAHAHADGTGGHQDHLMTGVFDVGDHLGQKLHPANVQMAGGMGQGGGTELDDDAHMKPPSVGMGNG